MGKCGCDCAECAQSSLDCNGIFKEWVKNTKNIYTHTFKPYFDVTLGKEITSEREIKDYCAKNNCIYAGDKEISQQCVQNKRENIERQNREFTQNLQDKLMRIL